MEEIVKMLIAIVVLVILAGAVVFLLSGKGGELLEGVKNLMKFGE